MKTMLRYSESFEVVLEVRFFLAELLCPPKSVSRHRVWRSLQPVCAAVYLASKLEAKKGSQDLL